MTNSHFPPVAASVPVPRKPLPLPRTRPPPQVVPTSAQPPVKPSSPVVQPSPSTSQHASPTLPMAFPVVGMSSGASNFPRGKNIPVPMSFLQNDLQWYKQKQVQGKEEDRKATASPLPTEGEKEKSATPPVAPPIAEVTPAALVQEVPSFRADVEVVTEPASTAAPTSETTPTVPVASTRIKEEPSVKSTPPRPANYNPLTEHLKSTKKSRKGPPGVRVLPTILPSSGLASTSSPSSIPTVQFVTPRLKKKKKGPPGLRVLPDTLLSEPPVDDLFSPVSNGSDHDDDTVVNEDDSLPIPPSSERSASESCQAAADAQMTEEPISQSTAHEAAEVPNEKEPAPTQLTHTPPLSPTQHAQRSDSHPPIIASDTMGGDMNPPAALTAEDTMVTESPLLAKVTPPSSTQVEVLQPATDLVPPRVPVVQEVLVTQEPIPTRFPVVEDVEMDQGFDTALDSLPEVRIHWLFSKVAAKT